MVNTQEAIDGVIAENEERIEQKTIVDT